MMEKNQNGALPHAQVTNRKFKTGDLIVVDLTLRCKDTYQMPLEHLLWVKFLQKRHEGIRYSLRITKARIAAKPGVLCSSVFMHAENT